VSRWAVAGRIRDTPPEEVWASGEIYGATMMEIGAAIFFTDYSMAPTALAVALEQRGFDSL
jgi:hypothetical protein